MTSTIPVPSPGLLERAALLVRRGSEPGEWCPADDLYDAQTVAPLSLLSPRLTTAKAPFLVDGRIMWDLALAGVPKITYVDGWRHRGNPTMDPFANLWHHTAGKPTDRRPAPSLAICVNGRPDVSGPLCAGLIALDGTGYIIASGRANHAGMGHKELLADVKRGRPPRGTAHALGLRDTGGNGGAFVGWEIENDGKRPYTSAQMNTIANIAKATRHRLGFSMTQSIQWSHAHWTPRKVDITFPHLMDQMLTRALASP